MKTDRHNNFLIILGVITLLGFLLRLLAGYELADTPAVATPLEVTDMATYRRLALALRQGVIPEVFDYQPFYYTVLLPFAYCFSPSGGVWPVIVLQALLGACAIWFSGLSAARLFGRLGGWLAAGLLALSQYHIFYTPYLLLEVPFSFCAALVLYLTIRAFQKPLRITSFMALGFVCGIALLTRGSALLWLPGLIVLLSWQHWHTPRRLTFALSIAAICFIAPILPYAIHNSRATGHLCGASVAGGKVLVLGNSPEAPAGGLEYPRSYHQWCEDESTGRRSVLSNILNWGKHEPLLFGDLIFRKLLLFWDKTEIPNNISFIPHADSSRILHLPILLPWAVIGTLALAFLLRHGLTLRRRQWLILSWLIFAYWGATSAFYLLARFRIGALPLLATAGGGFIALSLREFRLRAQLPRQRLLWRLFALVIALYTVCAAYPLYRDMTQPGLHRLCRPNGYQMHYQGKYIVYDHAPLLEGGQLPIELSRDPLQITKQLILSPEVTTQSPAVPMRLLLRAIAPASARFTSTLTVNGRRIYSQPQLIIDRQVQWFAWNFTASPQHQMDIALTLNGNTQGCAIFIDTLRDYHRTTLTSRDFQLNSGIEAVFELEVADATTSSAQPISPQRE